MIKLHIPIDTKLKASDLRKKAIGKKQPCYICSEHELITEQHHVISLNECALLLNRHGKINSFKTPLIWLCPNHHKYIHILFDCPRPSLDVTKKTLLSFTKWQIYRIDEIDEMRREIFEEHMDKVR